MNTLTTSLKSNGVEVGYFSIHTPSWSMSIFVEPEYQNKGYARQLMKPIVNSLPDTQLLYIDTDASQGFWDHIGMKPNRHYTTKRQIQGAGYEKVIDVKTLKCFLTRV